MMLLLIGCSDENVQSKADSSQKEETVQFEIEKERIKGEEEVEERTEPNNQALIPVSTDDVEYRYVNELGETVIEGPFSYANSFSEGFASVYDDDGNGYFIDQSGEKQFEFDYVDVGDFHDGLAGFSEQVKEGDYNLRYGFIDTDGDIAINPTYINVTNFSEGKALGIYPNTNGAWELHLIDKNGTTTVLKDVPVENVDGMTTFDQGVAMVYTSSESFTKDLYLIDLKGNVKHIQKYEDIGILSEGLIPVLYVNEAYGPVWGFIDGSGKEVIPPIYKSTNYFSEGIVAVQPWDQQPSNDTPGQWVLIDRNGELVVDNSFDEIGIFRNGLAAVKVDDLWGYIDTKGEMVIEPQFSFGFPFVDGLAAVLLGDKKAYINKDGQYVISPSVGDNTGSELGEQQATDRLWEFLADEGINKESDYIIEGSTKTEEGVYEFELYGPEVIDDPDTGTSHRNYFGRYGVDPDGRVYKYQ
ncbi:WG repeat-containing protein [Salirhabdus sp. Marseille-P4669]|uniref:WG repeat-containing protein n=1 Tax=Salirhabdus sp. Marseille-P4669 TaxID=2042310 RepID=UPI000C7AB6BF|nr:WG repeat-containing protein [Salirhabdus sp. Marseille-P4669]